MMYKSSIFCIGKKEIVGWSYSFSIKAVIDGLLRTGRKRHLRMDQGWTPPRIENPEEIHKKVSRDWERI